MRKILDFTSLLLLILIEFSNGWRYFPTLKDQERIQSRVQMNTDDDKKYWFGPTKKVWGDDQCKSLGESSWYINIGACKDACEKWGSCNAIVVKDANYGFFCNLKECDFPVPKPTIVPEDGWQGQYRATVTTVVTTEAATTTTTEDPASDTSLSIAPTTTETPTTPFPGRYCTKQTGLASNSNFTSELLSYTQSFEICVMARGEKGKMANGLNWKRETEECRGVVDATVIDTKQTKWETCIFTGTGDEKDQLDNEREQIDNQKCASICSKNVNCSSYEHTRYDNVCKLFKRDGVVNDGRSGYIHCDRLDKQACEGKKCGSSCKTRMARFVGICDDNGICEEDSEKKKTILEICNRNECNPNPCKNGATCINKLKDYSCNCPAGWQGKNCETDFNECESDPCQNGGTCLNKLNDYDCTCTLAWKGKKSNERTAKIICHVNGKGDTPKQDTCKPPYDKFCNYVIDENDSVTRNCSAGEGLWPKVRCIKTSKFTSCLCDTDNCNYQCLANECKKIQISRRDNSNADISTKNCKAICKSEEVETTEATDATATSTSIQTSITNNTVPTLATTKATGTTSKSEVNTEPSANPIEKQEILKNYDQLQFQSSRKHITVLQTDSNSMKSECKDKKKRSICLCVV